MWTHDVRQALRLFRREPAFAAAAVLTLTLGIGATTALFAVVEAVLLRPLPFDTADDLVVVKHRDVRTGLAKQDIAIGDFVDLRARQQSFEPLAGYGGFQSTLVGAGEPVRVEGVAVTPEIFEALRVRPALGRVLRAEDVREGAPPVVMVSHELWRTALGSDPNILSRSVQLGAARRIVVGVAPPRFRFPPARQTDVLVPLSILLSLAGGAAGVAVAWWAAPALASMIPQSTSIPGLERVGINRGVLIFSVGASIVSAFLFSAVACLGLWRAAEGGVGGDRRVTMTAGARTAASSLVAAEIALALVLLIGGGLTLRSFANLVSVDPGFTATGVLTVEFALPAGRYADVAARRAFYDRAFEAIERVPGIVAVGGAVVTPLTGNNWTVPLIYSTGPGIFWEETVRDLDHARSIVKRYSSYWDTKTIKMYVAGNRQVRQWILIAAREQQIMPTTEGSLDLKLNLTEMIDGYPGQEHSLPIFPLYKDVVGLAAFSRIAYTPTLIVNYGGPMGEEYYYTRENHTRTRSCGAGRRTRSSRGRPHAAAKA